MAPVEQAGGDGDGRTREMFHCANDGHYPRRPAVNDVDCFKLDTNCLSMSKENPSSGVLFERQNFNVEEGFLITASSVVISWLKVLRLQRCSSYIYKTRLPPALSGGQ